MPTNTALVVWNTVLPFKHYNVQGLHFLQRIAAENEQIHRATAKTINLSITCQTHIPSHGNENKTILCASKIMETVFGTTKLCFLWIFVTLATLHPCVCVGPCRPQVVDGGTASDVEGSCE